jgi:hypothetical protein
VNGDSAPPVVERRRTRVRFTPFANAAVSDIRRRGTQKQTPRRAQNPAGRVCPTCEGLKCQSALSERLRATPITPTSPAPNSQTAPGRGTAVGVDTVVPK